jgi:Tol biopolymer transport system component
VNVTVGQPQFALSPNGRAVVFAAAVAGARPMLWLRHLSEIETYAIAGTEDGDYPFWSADSEWVGFFAEGKLKRVRAAGGPVQLLTDVSDPRGGTWGPDGTIIFGRGPQSLYRLPPGGRTAVPVTTLDASAKEGSHRWPHFLPDGSHFVFSIRSSQRDQAGIYAGSLDGKVKKLLVPGDFNAAADVVPGFLLFTDGAVLLAQAFNAERLELSGEPFTVAEGVGRASNGYAAVSASSGTLAYARSNLRSGRLTWFDRGGKQLDSVGPEGDYTDLRLSPDEKRLAVSLVDPRTGYPDIWLTDLERGGSPFRFTSAPGINSAPAWSPDGSHVVFRTNRNGGQVELYLKSTAGAGNEEPVLPAQVQDRSSEIAFNLGLPDWSHDGRSILYSYQTSSGFELWLLSVADRKLAKQLSASFIGMHPNFSPDGRFVSYASNESGIRTEVYVQTFPLSDWKLKVSSLGGYEPRWRADGRELYYLSEDRKLMAVSVGQGPSFGVPELLFQTRAVPGVTGFRTHYVPSRDGKRFLINTEGGDTSRIPITVVLNWTAGLKP